MHNLSNVILLINKDHARYQRTNLHLIILSITDDYDDITLGIETSRRPIQTDDTRTTSTSNSVRLQPRTVTNVDHLHLFVRIDVGSLQQILVNRDTADIIE